MGLYEWKRTCLSHAKTECIFYTMQLARVLLCCQWFYNGLASGGYGWIERLSSVGDGGKEGYVCGRESAAQPSGPHGRA